MSAPKNSIVLARISDARDDDTHGVDAQVTDLLNYADRLRWHVGPRGTHVIVENDTSAYKRRKVRMPDGRMEYRPVRPDFWRALGMLRDGRADGLISIDLDRACRDPRDLEDLIDAVESRKPRIPVESVTGTLRLATTSDVSMARMLVAVANKASADTARRVSDSHKRRAAEGVYRGGRRRYGWERDGVTARPDEQDVINWAADGVLAGVSLRYLVRDLNERGVPTVTGCDWSPTTLRDILLRRSNAGLSVWTDPAAGEGPAEVGGGKWEPIMSVDRLDAVTAVLRDPARKTSPGNKPRWLVSLIARCGACAEAGLPLADSSGRTTVAVSGGREHARTYTCRALSLGTSHLRRLAGSGSLTGVCGGVDDFVARVIVARLAKPDAADLIAPSPVAGVDVSGLRAEAGELRELLDEQARMHARRVIDKRQLEAGTAELRAQLDTVNAQLRSVAGESPLAPIAGRPDAAEIWGGLDLGRRREIVKALVTVTLLPVDRLSGRVFSPESVRVDWITR